MFRKEHEKHDQKSDEKHEKHNIVEESIELIEESVELLDKGVKIVKKKLGIFYKVNIFISIFVSMILLYFLVLVPSNPKTIPQITQKIEKYLRKNFDEEATIETSYMQFTAYGTLKITIKNLKLNKIDQSLKNQEFLFPEIESEFSLFNLMLFRFLPRKIKIIDPEIIFYTHQNKELDIEQKENVAEFIEPMVGIVSAIRSGDIYIKNLEIENAKFITRTQDKILAEIFLTESKIKIVTKNSEMKIYSSNIVKIGENGENTIINSNCGFKTETARCAITLNNLQLNSMANLSDYFAQLRKIETNLDAMIDFSILN